MTVPFKSPRTIAMIIGLALAINSASAAEYTTTSAEMKIAIDLDFMPPQNYYDFDGKTLSWREPLHGDTHYIMVTLRDLVSSNPITASSAHAVLSTPKGKIIGTSITLHETWDKDQLHYGANIQVADELTSGNVTIKVDPPKGRRLGRKEGNFFTKSVTATFKNVDLRDTFTVPIAPATTPPETINWPKGRRPYLKPTPYPGSKN